MVLRLCRASLIDSVPPAKEKKTKLGVCQVTLHPDDHSPADPIQLLRNAIQGSDSPKRSSITGILHGEKVQLVNATLIVGECYKI